MICALSCLWPGFIGKITLQIPFYRPHSDPWVISMSQLNLIIGPAQLQDYDGDKEKEEERERKKRLLKALEDKFKVCDAASQIKKYAFCLLFMLYKLCQREDWFQIYLCSTRKIQLFYYVCLAFFSTNLLSYL